MVYYNDAITYLESTDDLSGRLTRMKLLRDALELQIGKGILTSNVQEYQLNDGQTIVRTIYRNLAEVERAYDWLDKKIIKLESQLVGRSFKLRDQYTIR
jgi:hypothetical protein